MALCPWVAWRPVLTGDLERTSWRRCPSHYLIHSFTNQRRARSAQAGAVEVSPRSEEHSCSHTLRGSEGDEEDPLHPIDRCAQKSEAGRGVLKENKAGRALHSRSRTPEVTAGDVLCSSHRPFKPWCTGAGLPLFTPTHNCSHPLTLAHTCSQEPTLCVSSPPLHSETSRGTLSSAAVGVFTRSRQQTLQIRPDPFGSRSPFTTHHRLRLVFPAPGEFLGWPRDFLVPVRRKAFPALLSHKNTVS